MPTLGEIFNRGAFRKGADRSQSLSAGSGSEGVGDALMLTISGSTFEGGELNFASPSFQDGDGGSSISVVGGRVQVKEGLYAVHMTFRVTDWDDSTSVELNLLDDVTTWVLRTEFPKMVDLATPRFTIAGVWTFPDDDFLQFVCWVSGATIGSYNAEIRVIRIA